MAFSTVTIEQTTKLLIAAIESGQIKFPDTADSDGMKRTTAQDAAGAIGDAFIILAGKIQAR